MLGVTHAANTAGRFSPNHWQLRIETHCFELLVNALHSWVSNFSRACDAEPSIRPPPVAEEADKGRRCMYVVPVTVSARWVGPASSSAHCILWRLKIDEPRTAARVHHMSTLLRDRP